MAVIKGSGKEVGELPPVECTYADCKKRFMDMNDMKLHKRTDPDHDYCKKCDVDCKDWDDLTEHKVHKMDLWLKGSRSPDEPPKHIVCEFCGEDFKSFGGQKRHRAQYHRAQQTIKCPTCDMIFHSAARQIAHLEHGECSGTTRHDFITLRQEKSVRAELMENGDKFKIMQNASTGVEHQSITDSTVQAIDTSCSRSRGHFVINSEAGTTLLDDKDDAQAGGYKPLEPQAEPVPFEQRHSWIKREDVETWPRLHNPEPLAVAESVANMSLKSPSISGSDDSGVLLPMDSATGSDYARQRADSGPSRISVSRDRVAGQDNGTASKLITTAAATRDTSSAWGSGNASKVLFKDAKPTPPPGNAAVSRYEDTEPTVDNSTNMLYVHFWDPSSPDYDPDRFLHSVTQTYWCPFPDCEAKYQTPSEIESHIHSSAHLDKTPRCPSCLKIFRSATALMAHCEDTMKCKIKDSRHFKKLIDGLSGGFLEAKRLHEPHIYKPGKALVKAGEPVNGVMSVRYTSKLPNA